MRSRWTAVLLEPFPLFTLAIVVFCFAFAVLQVAPKHKRHSSSFDPELQKWSQDAAASLIQGADTFELAALPGMPKRTGE